MSLNVTDITDKQATSTPMVGVATATYNGFPLAPRQFGTIGVGFCA